MIRTVSVLPSMGNLLGVATLAIMLTAIGVSVSSAQDTEASLEQAGHAAVYSAAQARRGKSAVIDICGTCHVDTDLVEKAGTWEGGPKGFFEYISSTMPMDNPGGLEPQQYADIVAYLLQQNDWPAGDSELTPESSTLTGLAAAAPAATASAPRETSTRMTQALTEEQILEADADPTSWVTGGQNVANHRYSRLDQINKDNISTLRAAFSVPLTAAVQNLPPTGDTSYANMQGTPLVIDGMLYIESGFGIVYGIDVSKGDRGIVRWTTDPEVEIAAEDRNRTRGLGAWGNLVYDSLVDGRVIAYDRETGEIVWEKQVGRTTLGYEPPAGGPGPENFISGEGFTGTPLVVEGKVFVAQSKGDWGQRGWVAALDAETGEELWRTYTVPAPGEPGHETWTDDHNAWRTGGGAIWTSGSYDPESRVTIWNTGNPAPSWDPNFRPGDNLYTNSTIAMDVDTGEIVWHYQYIPNEYFDFDEMSVSMLYDIDGEKRLGHFSRNGYFYQLERTTGEFIDAVQYVKDLNWTKGLDPETGKPVEYDPTKDLQSYAVKPEPNGPMQLACPGIPGGLRWQPPAYNPEKKIAYMAGLDSCGAAGIGQVEPMGPEGGNPMGDAKIFMGAGGTGKPEGVYSNGTIVAIDVVTNEVKAKISMPWENQSGILATSGGLVFSGNADGSLTAYNDETLEELWHFNVGAVLKAPPMTYSIDGKQYVAIVAGGAKATDAERGLMGIDAQLWVFTLP